MSALRLVEKGYSVLVLEEGRRFGPDDFAKSSWGLGKFLWAPHLGMRGIQRIILLSDVMVLPGAGVGGRSLVYANTLIEPDDEFFSDGQWADTTDWKSELEPWYDQGRRMLGVEPANDDTPADHVMAVIAEHFGRADTHHSTPIGVYRGTSGETVDDPYFGGVGPSRTGCTECGGCMVGCRFNAKNTLDKSYLYLAEQAGATVMPDSRVVDLTELGEGWEVSVAKPGAWFRGRYRHFRARQVIFSAGALGTTKLLLELRDKGRLPGISDRLGDLVRTNSEAIVGAVAGGTETDYSAGVAIISSFQADQHTRIEPVRYPKGSNSIGLLSSILVEGGEGPQAIRFIRKVFAAPRAFFRSLSVRRWAEREIILLVMQNIDNSIRLTMSKGWFRTRIRSAPGHGEPNPRWLPVAHEAARVTAEEMDGDPMGSLNESLLGIPVTAHLIGGAVIGATAADGAAVPANLGANPSLSITALTERALSFWPNRGDADTRPPLGDAYQPLAAVAPANTVVPKGAPAELRSQVGHRGSLQTARCSALASTLDLFARHLYDDVVGGSGVVEVGGLDVLGSALDRPGAEWRLDVEDDRGGGPVERPVARPGRSVLIGERPVAIGSEHVASDEDPIRCRGVGESARQVGDRELDQPLEGGVVVRRIRQFDREHDRSGAVDSYRGDIGTGSTGGGPFAERGAAVGLGVRGGVVSAAGGSDQNESQQHWGDSGGGHIFPDGVVPTLSEALT